MSFLARKLIIFTLITVTFGCKTSEGELPESIERFMQNYFASEVYNAKETADGGYRVEINNGATLTFNSDYAWTDINGNGVPLGGMLLDDILPEKLYDYLEETENLSSVYRITRNIFENKYIVYLLDSEVGFDASSNVFFDTGK